MGSVVKRLDVVAGRKYKTRNGEEKTHWINCGEAAMWDDGGITVKLHATPAGPWWDGTFKLFEQRERGAGNAPAPQRSAPAKAVQDDDDGDIPF